MWLAVLHIAAIKGWFRVVASQLPCRRSPRPVAATMSLQSVRRVVLLLAVALASCSVHCARFPPGHGIPRRCRELSVTPVSCANTRLFDNLLPHPDDCELFYYCVSPGSRPICRQCPAHLHFNPRLQVCDHPAFAGCNAPRPTNRPPDTTATDVGTTGASTAAETTVEPTVNTAETERTTTESPDWETSTVNV